MEKIKKPKFLYQYTSIESLAYILKDRIIKFNSLKNVDDLEECEIHTECQKHCDLHGIKILGMD